MEWINTIRWVIGGFAIAFGAFVAIGNWTTLIRVIITKGSTSFIPLIGGCLAVFGLLVIPLPGRLPWVWIPLLADWGCVPMFTVMGATILHKKMNCKQ